MRFMWKTIEADGCVWQVRTLANPETGSEADRELLEFQAEGGNRPARRLLVEPGSLGAMDDAQLRAAYLQSRPIGGDHYGRPGKQMGDVR
jgi:hypothetical protein